MYTNNQIIDKLQADKLLGLRLEHALKGVQKEVLAQANRVQEGATRLLFYTSCFTQNYQDVCANQKKEDTRFLEALTQLVSGRDIIYSMLKIYVDQLLQNLMPERIQKIQKILLKTGVNIASATLTNQALSAAIVAAACYSFGLTFSIDRKLAKIAAGAVTIAGYYGYVQEAADAANRLKQQNGMYYHALYAEKLEMMYFLIEPVISRNVNLSILRSTDEDIAEAIKRIIK
ncbi:hypothetical protein [Vagococcus sp. WN89Y]|uniref:hypothetical protein n=1 Tax=Vagococcus sp. WN89Y TaxID=3457258 RepID=UPI003FCC9690